jgi:hypothetical protein
VQDQVMENGMRASRVPSEIQPTQLINAGCVTARSMTHLYGANAALYGEKSAGQLRYYGTFICNYMYLLK